MRIALVTRQYWPAVGGVERVVENLGEAYVERGHDVRVVAQCVDELHFGRMTHIVRERMIFAPFTHRGMEVVQFRPSRARRALLLPMAAELIPLGGRVSRRWASAYSSRYYSRVVRDVLAPLLRGCDVMHVLGSNMLSVAAVSTAHLLGMPALISPFAHIGEWGDDAASISAYLGAEALLATTEADADAYRSLGVPSGQIHVVGLPVPDAGVVDRDAGQSVATLVPAQHGGAETRQEIPVEGRIVLFLGQRRPTKRHELLLGASGEVFERHPDARFAFVGPGAPLHASDARVLDVGRVSDAARAAWLDRAAVLCLPSASESFGMVVAEAWSRGVPVVVSDIPVLRELVERSGGGLVAAPDPGAFAHAISELLADSARAKAMGASGRAFWRANLTPDAVAERHLELYAGLARGAPASVNSSS